MSTKLVAVPYLQKYQKCFIFMLHSHTFKTLTFLSVFWIDWTFADSFEDCETSNNLYETWCPKKLRYYHNFISPAKSLQMFHLLRIKGLYLNLRVTRSALPCLNIRWSGLVRSVCYITLRLKELLEALKKYCPWIWEGFCFQVIL